MRLSRYLILLIFLLPALVPGAVGTVVIQEWPVPWPDTRPRDPYVETLQRVWFVGQSGNYLARLAPGSGQFSRYDLPQGAAPHNLLVDDDGQVWYAGNGGAHIGILSPDDETIRQIDLPKAKAPDPHTLVFDQQGYIWFSAQGGNHIGRLDMSSLDVKLLEVPTTSARPYGIIIDRNGRPWFTLFGSYKLGTIDPETLELREIELPRRDARPRRLAVSADGSIWYVDYAQGYLGRYDPGSGAIEEWRTPAAENARPYGMAVDQYDKVWLVETGISPNRLVGFDPERECFFSRTNIPSGGGTVRHMFYHMASHTLWFGTDTNTIARAELPESDSD